jgi:hypothetical protein
MRLTGGPERLGVSTQDNGFTLFGDLQLYGGLAVDGVVSPTVPPDTYAHLGAFLAIGAPYTLDWLGVSAEGGASMYIAPHDPQDGSATPARPGGAEPAQPAEGAGSTPLTVGAYGKGTLVLQLPREQGIRPYLAVSYLGSNDGLNKTVMADLGLAWSAW